MRTDRDEMVRYRQEVKALQSEIAALKSKKIIGVPEQEHKRAVEKLRTENERMARDIEALKSRIDKQREAVASSDGLAQENQKLESLLNQCRDHLNAERKRNKDNVDKMQSEINSRDNAIRRLRRGN